MSKFSAVQVALQQVYRQIAVYVFMQHASFNDKPAI